ncbi:hypothetical protein Mal48_24160 [Thalassoglobus polymorphus]|uniref:Uncharacterized protein n=1 Tax=Thalassoglobus polymorphus TaxID=2527994 RepID=A0A517QNF9_9PLAN|nr:hypothetical protein Mal48_24160 [Thalassoglobus polymorphus]
MINFLPSLFMGAISNLCILFVIEGQLSGREIERVMLLFTELVMKKDFCPKTMKDRVKNAPAGLSEIFRLNLFWARSSLMESWHFSMFSKTLFCDNFYTSLVASLSRFRTSRNLSPIH